MSKKTSMFLGLAIAAAITTGTIKPEPNEFEKVHKSKSEITRVVEVKNINKEIVKNAEEYLGMQYVFGGRDTEQLPGIDCLGVLFKSIEKVTGESWKKWSVIPSKLLKQFDSTKEKTFYNEDIKDKKFITDNFKEGDVLMFLLPYKNDKDVPVRKMDLKDDNGKVVANLDLWVWHVAIYSGKGNIIHASSFDENYSVLEENLFDFVKRNELSGVIKTNLK
jgi:hypothetical protein